MTKYRYFAVRGRPGYMHADCWPAFEATHSRYDTLGRCISRPLLSTILETFRGVRKEHCIQCGRPLLAKPKVGA